MDFSIIDFYLVGLNMLTLKEVLHTYSGEEAIGGGRIIMIIVHNTIIMIKE